MTELTPAVFLIVCPMLFLAGFVDAIGGGGGLISLPAFLFAGLPVHTAIATNKLSVCFGTGLATFRFLKKGLVDMSLALPSVLAAMAGSFLGARLSLHVSEQVLKYVLFAVLPAAAFVVLNKHLFHDNDGLEGVSRQRTLTVSLISAFVIGIYDGFYGPGTGTFLIIAFNVFARMSIAGANAQSKIINLTTNLTSLTVFFLNGQVLLPLGIAAALCNMAGNYLGTGLVMTKGPKIVRPIILTVLCLLLIKILTDL